MDKYELKPGDRRLTYKELLKTAAEWKANHRITGGTYEWVEDRHFFGCLHASGDPSAFRRDGCLLFSPVR